MDARQIIAQARDGRPDLAAKNIGANGVGAWNKPVRLLRIVKKFPHESGVYFGIAYLGLCWREGRGYL